LLAVGTLKAIQSAATLHQAIDLDVEFADEEKPTEAGAAFKAIVYSAFLHETYTLATKLVDTSQVHP
jgi:hypothetical protein